MRVVPRPLIAVLLVAGLAGCGSDDAGAPGRAELSPAGEVGRQLARDKGCAACHGANGEGNVGPAFVGLYGSDVALQDGTTVTADDDYLIRSIKDPGADKVDGYNLPMPSNDLTDTEIASILDYLRDLGAGA